MCQCCKTLPVFPGVTARTFSRGSASTVIVHNKNIVSSLFGEYVDYYFCVNTYHCYGHGTPQRKKSMGGLSTDIANAIKGTEEFIALPVYNEPSSSHTFY